MKDSLEAKILLAIQNEELQHGRSFTNTKAVDACASIAREQCGRVVELLNLYWSFDNNQCHTHNWHSKQDCIEKIKKIFA